MDRRGTLASLVIPDKFLFSFTFTDFFSGGGSGGALNSTREEFIPHLYRRRYPADRKDTVIGQSRHS